MCGSNGGYKRKQRYLNTKSKICEIERCTSPVLLDYCGPINIKNYVEESKKSKVDQGKLNYYILENINAFF